MAPRHITFFRSPAELRAWFTTNPAGTQELWVGYYKRNSGKASITWPESVDEALCVGWIDGVRKSLGDLSYTIRFTPRKADSTWSTVNIRRVRSLADEGRMRPAGLKAFQARQERRSRTYAYEQKNVELLEPYAGRFRRNKAAWEFFQKQAAWYRRTVSWWVMNGKKEETRMSRLEKLMTASARAKRL